MLRNFVSLNTSKLANLVLLKLDRSYLIKKKLNRSNKNSNVLRNGNDNSLRSEFNN